MNWRITLGLSAVVVFLLIALSMNDRNSPQDQGQLLSAESMAPGGGAYAAIVALKKVVGKYTAHDIEINNTGIGPRILVNLARNEIDIGIIVPNALADLQQQTGYYRTFPQAIELSEKIRFINVFEAGVYHFVTFADSGIEKLEDIAGKKVWAGYISGAGARSAQIMIRAATGYEAGVDYQLVDLDLRGGDQAFMDGHIDLMVRTPALGGAAVEQLGVSRDIRLLGLNERALNDPALVELSEAAGKSYTYIPAATYSGQVNEKPVKTLSFSLGTGMNKDADPQLVYEITRAQWQHLDEFKQVSDVLLAINRENAFGSMTGYLHPGAYRYYTEAGFDIPERLIPPELITDSSY